MVAAGAAWWQSSTWSTSDEVDEVDDVEDDDVVEDVVEEVVVVTLTLGPRAEQVTSATLMSSPRSWTWRPMMVIVAVPATLVTTCSLSVTGMRPAMVAGVFGRGLAGSVPPPTMAVAPVAPFPSARHSLVTTPMADPPMTTSATLDRLWEKPRWFSPATPPPSVSAVSTPMPSAAPSPKGRPGAPTGPVVIGP